ncbi:U-box domain-containing protein 3 [Senna tora]|uniref:RING-type E3 ubiquitin transferase n=1 Tax=Senna tora TaxID=362788 RepID=A0A834TJ44_9FABA|nr:U-box domain-containing protein 3 [Senna tora]
MIFRSLQSPPPTSVLASLQHYLQELKCLKKEPATGYIEEALTYQRESIEPRNENLKNIIELLGLKSNLELFKESIAVEKERLSVEVNKKKGELDEIDEIVNLVCNMRDYAIKIECPGGKSGVSIPSYFICPLSLELMADPVIVASGQTYERLSIQKWLDHGLTVCPKTRQRLTHTNLIPNYTVKAMIANWCEENNIKPPDNSESNNGNAVEKQKGDISSRLSGESNECQSIEMENFEKQSPALMYIDSRSESFSSSISSMDYAPPVSKEASEILNKQGNVKELAGEITNGCPASQANKESDSSDSKVHSLPVCNLGSDELTTPSYVNKLIEDLRSQSNEVQTKAAEELRLLSKHNMENRIIIGQCGAVTPLLSLLYSEVKITQEHAVTALLNLSISEDNKALIVEAGAIEPLIHVLKTGNDGAKENSAATLFSLSVIENYKAKIGQSGAVKALVDLLGFGTLRGKKDAATALFNLSICHENKARIVQAGAVKHLVQLMDPATGMVDKAVALLANLSTIAEGRLAIAREGGIPLLVDLVDSGSQRGKENAASVLLQLCLHSTKFCTLVLQEGAVPPLVALSQSGTPRAKEKAQQLLSHFRNQREGATGKGKA